MASIPEKPEVKKEELTKEELQVIANMIAQAQTQVQTAPKLIELVNKVLRMAKQ